jgi:hypothetical protein
MHHHFASRRRSPPVLIVGLLAGCLLGGGPAAAQEAAAKYPTWTKFELSSETRDFRAKLRDGGGFEAADREFVVRQALPQLGFESNRASIERVRRRIREAILEEMTDPKAYDTAARAVLEAMLAKARDKATDPLVGVNAMLLVGELRGLDRRPLPAALPGLVAAAADAGLPIGLRIAAAVGLSRHAETAAASGDVAAVVKAVAPALGPMLTAPTPGPAADWLASRALSIMQVLGPPAATKDALAAAAAILADESRPVDVRIRAGLALGATAGADSGLDVARAVAAVRSCAIVGLRDDVKGAEVRQFEAQLVGGNPQPQPPGPATPPPPPVPQLACRRDAWRLSACAQALEGPDGGSGLAALLAGDAAAAAKELAAQLRQSATSLDANPNAQGVVDALATLTQEPPASPAAAPAGSPPAPTPASPTQPTSPFDAPSPDSSPFGP